MGGGRLAQVFKKPLVIDRPHRERRALPELLVAGHHGAESSTGWALLARVQPEAVVVSVGEDNPYGHPSEAALRRIAAAGASILRTDCCGTITIRGAK